MLFFNFKIKEYNKKMNKMLLNIPRINPIKRDLPVFKNTIARKYQSRLKLNASVFAFPIIVYFCFPNNYLKTYPYYRHIELKRDFVSGKTDVQTTYKRNTSSYV
jgi:hypothetical protein